MQNNSINEICDIDNDNNHFNDKNSTNNHEVIILTKNVIIIKVIMIIVIIIIRALVLQGGLSGKMKVLENATNNLLHNAMMVLGLVLKT